MSEYIENAVNYVINLCKMTSKEKQYSAQNASSGDYAQNASSGDSAIEITTGENSVTAAIGRNSKIKAVKGTWITLAEYDNKGIVFFVKTARIGYTKQDGKVLKENVFYTLENKKFKEIS